MIGYKWFRLVNRCTEVVKSKDKKIEKKKLSDQEMGLCSRYFSTSDGLKGAKLEFSSHNFMFQKSFLFSKIAPLN